MSSNIYDNIPLNPLKKLRKGNKYGTPIPNPFNFTTVDIEKKRKSSPDIQKIAYQKVSSKMPKSSRSASEVFCKNDAEINENVLKDDFGSNETLKASDEEKCNENEVKKARNVQSTPTSTLDDGYESSNSTPLVSGKYIFVY